MSNLEPPVALGEERAVLGAIVTYGPALGRAYVEAGLQPEHFYLDKHRTIYQACLRLHAAGSAIDELTVGRALDADLRLLVSELAVECPVAANAGHYARQIIKCAADRARLAGAQQIIRGIHQKDDSDVQEGLERVNLDVELKAEPTTPEDIAAYMLDWFEQEPDPADLLPLPWKKLNGMTAGGFRKGRMSLVIGWSGQGKSLIVKDMLTEWHGQGRKCALFTTEMDLEEITCRWLSTKTGIPYSRLILRRKDLWEPGWSQRIVKALPEMPWHLYNAERWPVERICNTILTLRPDVAVIDPWNLLPLRKTEEWDDAAERLKSLARKARVHLVVVAHLNRGRLKEVKKPPPVESDIRSTGMLYNNAHYCLALHRDQDDHGNEQPTGRLYYLKARDGVKGSCKVELKLPSLRFEAIEHEPAPEQDPIPF